MITYGRKGTSQKRLRARLKDNYKVNAIVSMLSKVFKENQQCKYFPSFPKIF